MIKILLILISFSSQLWAQNVHEILDQNVKILQKKMGSGSSLLMANNAFKNQARIESFAIQGIARLFKKEDRVFKDLKDLIKSFEDRLGEVNKWSGFLSLPNVSAAKKRQYKMNFDSEMNLLGEFIKSSNFLPQLTSYTREIANLGLNEKSTKSVVIKEIKDDIDDVISTRYDFTNGETGLHEFRRNLRWILYELNAFKHFFTVKKSACRRTTYYELGAKSYYTALTENPTGSFVVNFCLYAELSGVVVYLGQMKETLELAGKLDDKVSPEIYSTLNKLSLELKRSILPHLL